MDDRRRTISSEEQMIGEALMRVSNTLEAQRLTKSLDYQEKLRSRSNIRLIIAVICLFTAMMMMMISGALLFVLWRYADPILDIVVPFAKGMTGDFATIWDGLVETLSYVPVMVEQLTRLLEQVIIMLEGINSFDLAGVMSYLSKMLDGVFEMLDGLKPALDSMMDSVTRMLQGLADNGLDGLLTELFGADAAENISALMTGMMDMLGSTGTAMSTIATSLSENIKQEDMDALVQGGGELLQSTSEVLEKVASGLGDIDTQDVKDVVAAGSSALAGASDALEGLGNAMSEIGEALGAIDIDTSTGIWALLT